MTEYQKFVQLRSGNRVLKICNENMRKINNEFDKILKSPIYTILSLRKWNTLNTKFEYYRSISKRIIDEK